MKLSALRYLVAFADEGSFSRAADRCDVAQPSLSVALQNLEAELGVSLIERSKGHATLTEVGLQVVAQARRALDEADRVELVAQLGKDPLHGGLRLGVIHTIGPYLLPALIASLRHQAPELTLYIEESMTSLLADNLKYGQVDAVIVALPFEVPGVESVVLYDEKFEVIVPKGHPWSRRKSLRREDIRGDDVLVLKAGNCFREQVLDACPEISHADGSLLQGHSIETIRCMVASGYGVSVLPSGALVGPYRSDMVAAIPFSEPAPARRVVLAWRRGFARLPAIDAIVSAVRNMKSTCYQTPAGAAA